MNSGVLLKMVWFDSDVKELLVEASNGRFSGSTRLYVEYDFGSRVAEVLRGFPETPSDVRELILGTLDPSLAGGGAKLRLRCFNAAGHVACHVFLRSPAQSPLQTEETVELVFPVEPASIDQFILELGGLETNPNTRVQLRSAT